MVLQAKKGSRGLWWSERVFQSVYSYNFAPHLHLKIGEKLLERFCYQALSTIVLATVPLALTAMSLKCGSPVYLSFKTWNIQYTYEKGSCDAFSNYQILE